MLDHEMHRLGLRRGINRYENRALALAMEYAAIETDQRDGQRADRVCITDRAHQIR